MKSTIAVILLAACALPALTVGQLRKSENCVTVDDGGYVPPWPWVLTLKKHRLFVNSGQYMRVILPKYKVHKRYRSELTVCDKNLPTVVLADDKLSYFVLRSEVDDAHDGGYIELVEWLRYF